MRILLTITLLAISFACMSDEQTVSSALCDFSAAPAPTEDEPKKSMTYKWVDEDGVVHFSDSLPEEFADGPVEIINGERVTPIPYIDRGLDGRVVRAEDVVSERRNELFRAQAKVTEMYLRGMQKRIRALRSQLTSIDGDERKQLLDEICSMEQQINETTDQLKKQQEHPPDPPTVDTSNMANRQ